MGPEDRIVDMAECDGSCSGDSTQKCGGAWRMNVYRIVALTDMTLTGYKYKYYPWPAGSYQLIVEVKGDRDANIMFTPCSGCQGYRVLLGGWDNQLGWASFIRDNEHDGKDQTLVQTPDILSTTEFRRFYI